MPRKEYEVGDRIFYEYYPSREVGTAIIKRIENQSYIDDNGKEMPFKWLVVWESGSCSSGIEDYSCLPYNDQRVKKLMKKYKKFDKEKDNIVESIVEMLSPYDKSVQEEAIELVKIKFNIE